MLFNDFRSRTLLIGFFFVLAVNCGAFGQTLRIASWNIEDDINGATTPLPGLGTVLLGLGNGTFAGDAKRPLDILGLEETTSNTVTVAPIVADLNADYPGSNYMTTPNFQASTSGNSVTDGNGPNSIVYNANTVTLIAAVGVGTPEGSTNGEYRQVARYEFMPVGGTSPFYLYVSHSKSGTGSSDATARGEEAAIIRTDETSLPANASVLYTGDLNSAPPEAEFTNYTSATATNSSGATVTQGEAYDPENFSASVGSFTESSTDLRYRDDYQLMTNNVLTDTGAINYVQGSLTAFGNNGTTASGGNVDSPSTTGGSNTALAYMTYDGDNPTQAGVLNAESTASDHLPVVADYTFTVTSPEPTSLIMLSTAVGFAVTRRRRLRLPTAVA